MPTVISDERQFAFIHIPKTGGTTIGRQLMEQLPHDPRFAKGHVKCRHYGKCYSDHLALWQIRNIAPDMLKKLLTYDSMAIVRDPLDRFRSALSQFARNTQRRELHSMTKSEVKELVDLACRGIRGPELGTLPFTFFRPQNDQVFLDGQRYVSHLFDYRDLECARAHILKFLAVNLDLEIKYRETKNFTRGYRAARTVVAPVLRGLLSTQVFARIKDRTTERFKTRSNLILDSILETPHINRMLQDFYGPDFELLKLTAGRAGQRVSISLRNAQGE